MEVDKAMELADGLVAEGQEILEQLRHLLSQEVGKLFTKQLEDLQRENRELKQQLQLEKEQNSMEKITLLKRELDLERQKRKELEAQLESCRKSAGFEIGSPEAKQAVGEAEEEKISDERRSGEGPKSIPEKPDLDSDGFRTFLTKQRYKRTKVRTFKYVESVRGRERDALPAFECPDCAEFYAGLKQDPQSKKCTCLESTATYGSSLMAKAGRHRARYSPAKTPDRFWDLGFPDSPEKKKNGKE